MPRRFIIALIACFVAVPLAAQDDACSADAPPLIQHRSSQMDAFLAPIPEPFVADEATAPEAPLVFEVLVARRDADGKIVFACVDSAAAAKRFLETRADKISTGAPTSK